MRKTPNKTKNALVEEEIPWQAAEADEFEADEDGGAGVEEAGRAGVGGVAGLAATEILTSQTFDDEGSAGLRARRRTERGSSELRVFVSQT